MSSLEKQRKNFYPYFWQKKKKKKKKVCVGGGEGEYGHFQQSVNLLTPMGIVQFICSVYFLQLVIFK